MKERAQSNQGTGRKREKRDVAPVIDFPTEVCERERKRWSNGLHGAFENW
jgi:hypothetical protein